MGKNQLMQSPHRWIAKQMLPTDMISSCDQNTCSPAISTGCKDPPNDASHENTMQQHDRQPSPNAVGYPPMIFLEHRRLKIFAAPSQLKRSGSHSSAAHPSGNLFRCILPGRETDILTFLLPPAVTVMLTKRRVYRSRLWARPLGVLGFSWAST